MATTRRPLSRTEMLHLCEIELRQENTVPRWAANVTEEADATDFVSSLENLAERVVREAKALSTEPPLVRLTAVAHYLGAEIEFTDSEADPAYSPSLRHNAQLGGSLTWTTNRRWLIRAGMRNIPKSREVVAHELAHAILYRRRNKVDISAWLESGWSQFEEVVCDYLARALLVPTGTLPLVAETCNASEFVASNLVGRYGVTYRLGTLSWIDELRRRGEPIVAALFWRQYHPLHDRYIALVLPDDDELAIQIREFCAAIRSACPEISYSEARSLLRALLDDRYSLLAFRAKGLSNELSSQYHTLREKVRTEGQSLGPALRNRLTGASYEFGLRPEWVVWPNQGKAFVPLWRGSFRSGSMAQRIACQEGTVCDRAQEQIDIGDLHGMFVVHGFAHGNADQGKRFILQMLFNGNATVDPI